ncbi:MAG: PKD domain-containing protein [bacterium]|nr:PKD domain-containing protein [bacterium]
MKLKQFVLIFSVSMLFAFMGFVQAAQIEKGPYLIYEGDNTGMTVLWQLDATDACTLEWGTDTTYSAGSVQTAEYGSDHQHKYVISNLNNATRYYYRVTFGSSSYTGSFLSAPSDSAQNVKFFAYGDTRSDPASHDDVANQMIYTYTADGAYRTFTLHVGDWINYDTENDWAGQFFPRSYANIIQMQSELAIQGCMGNHEAGGGGVVYRKYYPYPYVGSRFYWSFDYGPVHVAVVDQYTDYSPGSTQYNWLVNDLASTGKNWIFLVFHEPGWSASGPYYNNIYVQNYIQPLCTQYGVDIVFCGHNHYYAQCDVAGIKHITTGGGGAPLYPTVPGSPFLVTSAQEYHHCEIDIQGNQLDFVARSFYGAVLDYFLLIDNNGTYPPVAEFTADDTTISVEQSVTFTDQSTNNPTTWSWDFGDGGSSPEQDPVYAYNTAGVYTVSLTAGNSAGSDIETKPDYIRVLIHPPLGDLFVDDGPYDVGVNSLDYDSTDIRVTQSSGQTQHHDIISGMDNLVNVSVHNIGGTDITGCTLKVYWGDVSTANMWPDDFNQIGSTLTIPGLAAGETHTHTWTWYVDPAIGLGHHFCLIAVTDSIADPMVGGPPWCTYVAPYDNNIGQKNVTIIEDPGTGSGMTRFVLQNNTRRFQAVELVAEWGGTKGNDGNSAIMFLSDELDALVDSKAINLVDIQKVKVPGMRNNGLKITGQNGGRVSNIPLAPGGKSVVTIMMETNDKTPGKSFEVRLHEESNGKHLGALTVRLLQVDPADCGWVTRTSVEVFADFNFQFKNTAANKLNGLFADAVTNEVCNDDKKMLSILSEALSLEKNMMENLPAGAISETTAKIKAAIEALEKNINNGDLKAALKSQGELTTAVKELL